MEHKTVDVIEIKAEGDAGEFSALASVFGNVDLVGDRMMPGSFTKTLENWRASGKPIPIVWSHDWDDPMKFIGKADPRAVMETDKGLLVQGKLDIGNGNPVADQVHRLMKNDIVTGWSFGYTVGDQKRANGANEVYEVDLVEVGPTLKGANPAAQTEAVKSFAVEVKTADRLRTLAKEVDGDEPEMALKMRELADEFEPTKPSAGPPAKKQVEDARDEERRSSPKAQDPLRQDIDRVLLAHGELPTKEGTSNVDKD